MRFLIDEDLPPAVAELLRALGQEAEHVRAIGLGGASDQLVFAEAQKRQAVLLSADMGFANLRQYPVGTHCGIVVLRFPDYFRRSEIVGLVRRFVENGDLNALRGALVIVTPGSVRFAGSGERARGANVGTAHLPRRSMRLPSCSPTSRRMASEPG